MKRRITEAKEVMNNMDMQIKVWRSELIEAEIQMDCAPGDAMMVGGARDCLSVRTSIGTTTPVG